MSVEILSSGTRIKTKSGHIEGLITGMCNRDARIMYEMSYFNNGLHVACWLYRFEFDVMPERTNAGFVKEQEPPKNNLINV